MPFFVEERRTSSGKLRQAAARYNPEVRRVVGRNLRVLASLALAAAAHAARQAITWLAPHGQATATRPGWRKIALELPRAGWLV